MAVSSSFRIHLVGQLEARHGRVATLSFTLAVRLWSCSQVMEPVRRPSLHHFGFILYANWRSDVDGQLRFLFLFTLAVRLGSQFLTLIGGPAWTSS